MATRAEVLEKLKTAASEGNIREAYREFEELPIVDQLAISVSPGVGDALAVYEVGEFAQRGSESLEEDEFLGALGNYGLSALAAASLIPIFRFFRGARAIKAAPTEEIKLLPDLEPTKVVEEATKDVPIPKVEEFKPLSLDEQMYPGTMFDNKIEYPADFPQPNFATKGLTSKAAKFVNTSKKLPNQGKAQAFINAIKKSGVPEGELRLLNLIDETGEIHPKLMSELEIRNPQGKITRQRLANYIKSNQQGALSRRRINNNQFAERVDTPGASAIKENTYHVRGTDRKGRFDHYSSIDEHKDNFVFDSIANLDLREAAGDIDLDSIDKVRGFVGGNSLLNISRIQSDYAEELGELASRNKQDQIDRIRASDEYRTISNNILDDSNLNDLNFAMSAIEATVRQASDLSPVKLRDKLFKDMLNDKTPVGKLYKEAVDENDDFADVDIGSLIKPEYFEKLIPVVKKAQADFPLTPYVDSKKVAALKKDLNTYNQNVPKINKLAREKFEILKERKASGLTPESPSYLKIDEDLAEIDKQISDIFPEGVFNKFDGYTLSKTDLEETTGKPFTESLGKSIDEIFYDLERLRGGDTGPIRQKYGPGTPEERALKYFNELVNNSDQTFNLGNGLFMLKKATKINPDLLKGYAIDPYAKRARSDVTKFPIRSNFLRAVTEGKDGMYLDSATKRLGKEGGSQYDILQTTYKEAENEIAKIIKELGEDPKKYVRKFDDVDGDLDGTYVKIDDQIRDLVKDKGVDAFKDGGPVSIDNMLANL
jgi:Txe/YoeB family toxin of Txe-Axe toxin-antitoxin module